MNQLFTEVTSPKNVDKAEAEKRAQSAQEKSPEAQAGTTGSAKKKAKHGEDGVCCGGCS